MNTKIISDYPICDMFRKEMYKHTIKKVANHTIDMYEECKAVIPMIGVHVREAEDCRFYVHFKEEAIHVNSVRHMCELFLTSVEVLRTDEKKLIYEHAQEEITKMIHAVHKNSILHDVLSSFYVKIVVASYRIADHV